MLLLTETLGEADLQQWRKQRLMPKVLSIPVISSCKAFATYCGR
jgi:hypothetical protein